MLAWLRVSSENENSIFFNFFKQKGVDVLVLPHQIYRAVEQFLEEFFEPYYGSDFWFHLDVEVNITVFGVFFTSHRAKQGHGAQPIGVAHLVGVLLKQDYIIGFVHVSVLLLCA